MAKEDVSWTYKGFEGYLANEEVRQGKQHCQGHTPDFIKETLRYAHKLMDKQLLFRLDLGNEGLKNKLCKWEYPQ